MQVKKQQLEPDMENGLVPSTPLMSVHQGSILSLCLFNLDAVYIMWNAGLDETQAGIKIAGRNINNLSYADEIVTKLRESKEPLDESERKEWKSWLKT